MERSTSDARLAAQVAILKPLDNARAVFRGQTIVGHRESVRERRMLWAMPGGNVRTTAWLQQHDPKFAVLDRPSDQLLRDMHAQVDVDEVCG
jgi:hypothetical protein